MEERVFNFSAGPSAMPEEVLMNAQRDLLCYPGAGCSVLEMSHRSPSFDDIIRSAEETLRRIMHIPDEYAVLFLQGGASLQFAMVPMNLADRGARLAYAVTGQFAEKAYEEGCRWGEAVILGSSKAENFTFIPELAPVPEDAALLHMTGNNTIFGTVWNRIPEHGRVPLVADWSSAILGMDIPVDQYDLIYAGAQKNMGPAGLTVVILKKSLLEKEVDPMVPTMLRYRVAADNGSMYNTPPTFAIYMASLMAQWVEKEGGVGAMEQRNREKAALLYDFIDNSKLFRNPVRPVDRSIMNVPFTLPDKAMTAEFLELCKARGMINLKGHRLVGGCRASIYNGMPMAGVRKLVDTMKEYELKK